MCVCVLVRCNTSIAQKAPRNAKRKDWSPPLLDHPRRGVVSHALREADNTHTCRLDTSLLTQLTMAESWISTLLAYKSIKFITVRNPKLALFNYFLMTSIAAYVIAYTVIFEKGYQDFGGLVGTVSPKVKGVGFDNRTGLVYDLYDAVLPAVEQDSLFVTTKYVRTEQTRGTCAGDDGSTEACETDADCPVGEFTENGRKNGTCDVGAGFCFIDTWCPLEIDTEDTWQYVENVENWTILVKSNVRFPKFNVSRTNALNFQGNGAPTLGENLFTVRDLIEGSNYDGTDEVLGTGSTFEEVLERGAIIQVTLQWDCDFDRDESQCVPEFDLERIDDIQDSISTGFNYRLVESFKNDDGSPQRDLFKLYGIRFTFENNGQGGKFNFASLTVTLGAGLALLGVSTVICDLLLEYLMPGKDVVYNEKYTILHEDQLVDDDKLEPMIGSDDQPSKTPAGASSSSGSGSSDAYDPPDPKQDEKTLKLEQMRKLQAMGYSRDISAQAIHAVDGASIQKAAEWADAEQRRSNSESIDARMLHNQHRSTSS